MIFYWIWRRNGKWNRKGDDRNSQVLNEEYRKDRETTKKNESAKDSCFIACSSLNEVSMLREDLCRWLFLGVPDFWKIFGLGYHWSAHLASKCTYGVWTFFFLVAYTCLGLGKPILFWIVLFASNEISLVKIRYFDKFWNIEKNIFLKVIKNFRFF